MDPFILRRLQINGERMVKGMNGKRNGLNSMVPMDKQINGRISGAALTQTHRLRLATLMFGMKGTSKLVYRDIEYNLSHLIY